MVKCLSIFIMSLFLVQCVKSKCDLLIENVKITPNNPKIGDKVAVSYTVRNNGPGILHPGYYVSYIYFDDELTTKNSGPASKRKSGEYSIYGKAAGYYDFILKDNKSHIIKIIAKTKNNVIDENASNNEIEFSIESNGTGLTPIHDES